MTPAALATRALIWLKNESGILRAIMCPSLIPDSPIRLERNRMPLSLQVASLVRHRLQQGEWKVGDHLPTLEAFMAEYGVSRVTMRMALSELAQEGLIERGRGRGTIVIADVTQERWLILPNEWSALVSHIERLHAHVVELESGLGTPAITATEGKLAPPYWRARRVNWTRQAPYSLMTIYLKDELFQQHQPMYRKQAVLPILAQHAAPQIAHAQQVLTIAAANVEVARHLQLQVGTPVAEVRRIVRNAKQEILYLADVIYPAKHVRQETQLLPPAGP